MIETMWLSPTRMSTWAMMSPSLTAVTTPASRFRALVFKAMQCLLTGGMAVHAAVPDRTKERRPERRTKCRENARWGRLPVSVPEVDADRQRRRADLLGSSVLGIVPE